MYSIPRFSIALLLLFGSLYAADIGHKVATINVQSTDHKTITIIVPESGTLADIAAAYEAVLNNKGTPIPDGYELKISLRGTTNPDHRYTRNEVETVAQLFAIICKKETAHAPEPSWDSVDSKSSYFKSKYKKMVATVNPTAAQDATFLQTGFSLSTALKELVNKMGPMKPYLVIQEMFKKADEKPHDTIFAYLPESKNIQAIAALQKINGNGDAFTYKSFPERVDPLLGVITLSNSARVEMTVYRLLYTIIQELDDLFKAAPLKQASTAYNFLSRLDQALG